MVPNLDSYQGAMKISQNEPGMMVVVVVVARVPACNPSPQELERHMGQEFKVTLDYTGNLELSWATGVISYGVIFYKEL